MKSITTTQTIEIEGQVIPVGTKIGVYQSRPGISFDAVIGTLTRGCVEVADDDGKGFEEIANPQPEEPKPEVTEPSPVTETPVAPEPPAKPAPARRRK